MNIFTSLVWSTQGFPQFSSTRESDLVCLLLPVSFASLHPKPMHQVSLSTFFPLLFPNPLQTITDFCLKVVENLQKIFPDKTGLCHKRFFPPQESSIFNKCLLSPCHCKSEIKGKCGDFYVCSHFLPVCHLPPTYQLENRKKKNKKKTPACDANLHLFSYFSFFSPSSLHKQKEWKWKHFYQFSWPEGNLRQLGTAQYSIVLLAFKFSIKKRKKSFFLALFARFSFCVLFWVF